MTASPLSDSPLDFLKVIQRRSSLPGMRRHLRKGGLTIGFMGGSISVDNGRNWPDAVISWFLTLYPNVFFTVENAAEGATGSDSGCLRAQQEIINRGCELVFIEYAVNDHEQKSDYRLRTREGLIRKLLVAGIEVVLVYTFSQVMYAEMMAGQVPASINEFEAIAQHYDLNSVWMGLHALRAVRNGQIRWDEWLPDTLHPQARGSLVYAQAVIDFLSEELLPDVVETTPPPVTLPEPLTNKNWEDLEVLSLIVTCRRGPWILKRNFGTSRLDQILETQAPGAQLSFDFTGRGLVLVFQYGKVSSEFKYRVDGGEWIEVQRERHEWAGDRGRSPVFFVADELPREMHHFELEVIHGNRPDCFGCECRLAIIGVLTGKM